MSKYLNWDYVYGELKTHEKEIAEDYKNGDENAIRVVKYYDLFYKCPSDNCAKALLMCAYEDYVKNKEAQQ